MTKIINLSDFAEGAVAERVNIELQKALENLADPNTDPKKARTITLKITMKGDDKRDLANVTVTANTKLAPAKDIETRIVLDRDGKGKVVGQELKSGARGQTFVDVEGDVSTDTGEKIISFKKQGGSN
ncbi:replication terminator protein [Sutcliffiella horikoshii]|uniref:replication terminator protein n=1 Tax=Sutcliffiella horikoshii TaxID=79883 RepID=UPI003CF81B0E